MCFKRFSFSFSSSKRRNKDGILFTSRPLRTGETFEIELEQLSRRFQGAGMEFGLTDLNPACRSLFDLPSSMTDVTSGRTVMVSGYSVLYNNQEIDSFDDSVAKAQVSIMTNTYLHTAL